MNNGGESMLNRARGLENRVCKIWYGGQNLWMENRKCSLEHDEGAGGVQTRL